MSNLLVTLGLLCLLYFTSIITQAAEGQPISLWAVSSTGSNPFSQQAIGKMKEVLALHSDIKKDDIEFRQTAVVRDADSNSDVVMGLFVLSNQEANMEGLTSNHPLSSNLDVELSKALPDLNNIRSTFAIEVLPDHCYDGVQNEGETGVDCGGQDCLACGPGEKCSEGAACTSGKCKKGKCTALRNNANINFGIMSAVVCSLIAVLLSVV